MSFRYDLNQLPYDYIMELMNRFKRLDLVDRMSEELCMEVSNIVQEVLIIPKKKKCKKAKWLSAAAVKSLQSCPTLCDPIDSSPPGSPIPGTLQARTLEWVAISFSKWLSNALQIAGQRREMKDKVGREEYTKLNAENSKERKEGLLK